MTRFLKSVHLGTSILKKYETFSEKLKGGRVEKLGLYWKGVYMDYKEVFAEVAKDARLKPKRSVAIGLGLGLSLVALKTNPDERTLRDQLLINSNRILLVSDELRNPKSNDYVHLLFRSYNEGLLRVFSFGVFSVLWFDDYDKAVDLYTAQCSYLKPKYLEFHKRIADVGCFGKWQNLEWKLKDYDVNDKEWEKESS